MGPLRYGEGHHAVNAHRREQQRERREAAVQDHSEPVERQNLADLLVQRPDPGQWQIWINRVYGGCDTAGHAGRIARRARRDSSSWPWALPERDVYFRKIAAQPPAVADVVEDADDLQFHLRHSLATENRLIDDDPLRQRVNPG